MSPAAGTHRSDSGVAQMLRLSAVGISGLQVGMDVKVRETRTDGSAIN